MHNVGMLDSHVAVLDSHSSKASFETSLGAIARLEELARASPQEIKPRQNTLLELLAS